MKESEIADFETIWPCHEKEQVEGLSSVNQTPSCHDTILFLGRDSERMNTMMQTVILKQMKLQPGIIFSSNLKSTLHQWSPFVKSMFISRMDEDVLFRMYHQFQIKNQFALFLHPSKTNVAFSSLIDSTANCKSSFIGKSMYSCLQKRPHLTHFVHEESIYDVPKSQIDSFDWIFASLKGFSASEQKTVFCLFGCENLTDVKPDLMIASHKQTKMDFELLALSLNDNNTDFTATRNCKKMKPLSDQLRNPCLFYHNGLLVVVITYEDTSYEILTVLEHQALGWCYKSSNEKEIRSVQSLCHSKTVQFQLINKGMTLILKDENGGSWSLKPQDKLTSIETKVLFESEFSFRWEN